MPSKKWSEIKGLGAGAGVLAGFSIFERYKPAALAVSGGPDSVALMHLARRWCGLTGRDPSLFVVLTVDHGLRPESKREAEFVGGLARELGFPHETLTWIGPKPVTGVQAAARESRYALMTAYCRAHGIACLATAHTENDQAETMLMRLRRGSGLDGLAAMPQVSERNGVALVRPLLGISKARLIAYLRAHSIPFVHDPSNDNLTFERTRLRHAMKALVAAGVTRHALAMSAARLNRCREALNSAVEQFLDQHLVVLPLGQAEIKRAALDAAPAEISLRAFSKFLPLIGGQEEPPRLVKLERLLDLLPLPRWETTLGGCVILGSPEAIQVFREVGRMKNVQYVLKPGETIIFDRRFQLSLGAEAAADVKVKALGAKGWEIYAKAAREAGEAKGVKMPPRLPALATPALWDGERLIGAPLLPDFAHVFSETLTAEATLLPRLARFLKPISDEAASALGKQSPIPYL
jgi:tRNA(Ile)-lysidine synthase